MAEPKRIRVVAKAMAILRLFAGADDLSLTEIARSLSANASSVHHVVQTLVEEGFLRQDSSSRRYSLGPALLSLVPPSATNAAILACAESPLFECSRTTGLDVWLGMLELDRVYYVARVDGDSPLKVHMPLLKLQPAHCVSAGRVILSALPRARARAILERHVLRKMTASTCVDIETLLDAIERVRTLGYSEVDGEHIEGASDISVPVYGINGVIIAAITIGAPTDALGPERRQAVLPHLLSAAAQTQRALIGQPD